MPIRTHRGRAAVYRTVWGWPLRSPSHLAVVVVMLVAVGAGVAVALPGDGSRSTTAGAPPTADRSNAFDPSSRAAAPGASSLNRFESRETERARSVADAWVRAYLTTPEGMTSTQWVEQLRPYTVDGLLPDLRTVDPANVPDARITGSPRTISVTDTTVEFDVPTSAVVLRLSLSAAPEGWRVGGYERAG
ncbi:MAG: hypothetical protein GEU83_18080 [Pseudonocardiaceae bacterium]|nr:hypothetical protein [Pseudonocardiaceae bacterium]